MLDFTTAQIGAWIGSFLWPMFRIMGFFISAPLIGTRLVPARVRLVLAIAVTLVVVPTLPAMPQVDGLSVMSMLIVGHQLLIGLAMGFFMQLLFQVFVLAGQMIAMQTGLGFASMVDPTNGVNVAIISSFFLMLTTFLFIAFNGHLVMIEILIGSFTTLPVGFSGIESFTLWRIVNTISWVFSSALGLALPSVTALLIVNFAFGVMTRAAPQMNIFALGFPVALMFGLFIIWVNLSELPGYAVGIFEQSLHALRQLLIE